MAKFHCIAFVWCTNPNIVQSKVSLAQGTEMLLFQQFKDTLLTVRLV